MPIRASLILLALVGKASAGDQATLEQAESLIRQGLAAKTDAGRARSQFLAAAEKYEELRRAGVQSADVCLNQGNAYFLAGDLPQAILAYRRGLRLAPHDHQLRENLDLAREKVRYPADPRIGRPPTDDWPPWLPQPSPALTFWLAILCYALTCAGWTWWWATRRSWLLGTSTILLLLVALLGLRLFLLDRAEAEYHSNPVVVVARDGVKLYKGNGTAYPLRDDLVLNAGVEARLRHRRGDWLQIELTSGEVGWLPRALPGRLVDCLVDE